MSPRLILIAIGCLLTASGCTRAFYRIQADNEVDTLVDRAVESNQLEFTDDFTINIDPRSRLYDPENPDRPPMPPSS